MFAIRATGTADRCPDRSVREFAEEAADMDESRYEHSLEVGDRAHRIVGLAVAGDVTKDRSLRAVRLAEVGQQVFAHYPVTTRAREARFQAITAAGVYVNRFLPDSPWTLLGVELRTGRSRFDLVFEDVDGDVIIDELKLGVGRAGEQYVRRQIDGYLNAGVSKWGTRFKGVRMCCVHEPLSSRWVTPGHKRSSLLVESDTPTGLALR